MAWQADHHEGSSGTEVVDGLLVGSRGGSGDDSNIRSRSTRCSLDVGNEVLRLPEVNPLLSTKLQSEIALLGTSIYE